VVRLQRSSALDGHRVLLVEDAADIRDVVALLLRADGAEVRTAATGREALEIAGEWTFDVLLTDLGLPDLPGDALIRQVLALKSRRPRVVVMTGFSEPYHSQARAAGANAILTKPLDWLHLRTELTTPNEALAA
jgi:CheY-like chemotaxis protein